MNRPWKILLVEDSPTQAEITRRYLADTGMAIAIADSLAGVPDAVAAFWPDVVIVDLGLPDGEGLEVLDRLRDQGCDATVVIATSKGSVANAVSAMKAGASDFLVKPFNAARLRATLESVLEERRSASDLADMRTQPDSRHFHAFIGQSSPMKAVYRTIVAAAASRAPVFATGESGTGKELAAIALHRSGHRAAESFVTVNCAALTSDRAESELFGHLHGACPEAVTERQGAVARAHRGTLFLDEICELPLPLQPKLLHFLQTGEYVPVGGDTIRQADARIVSATNRDPLREVAEGRFREDLFYRLHVVPLPLPPLRERGNDVLLIAHAALARYSDEEQRRFRAFSPEAERALLAHRWPGNVRQLLNTVRQAVVRHDAEQLEAGMLALADAPAPVTGR